MALSRERNPIRWRARRRKDAETRGIERRSIRESDGRHGDR
jgi:hypothetical protein